MLKIDELMFLQQGPRNLIIVLLFLSLIGCKTKQDNLSEGVIHFPISWPEVQEVQKEGSIQMEGNWFDTLEVVNSLDVDIIPLNRIIRIIKIKDQFIALSDKIMMACTDGDTTVFVFNKIGRGPGEYDALLDVVYDEKDSLLRVLTSYPNKILTLDLEGNFISSYELPSKIDWDRFYMFKENLFLFGYFFDQNTKISQDVVAKYQGNNLTAPVVITQRLLLKGTTYKYWTLGEREGDIIVGIHKRDSLFRVSENLSVTPVRLNFAFEKDLTQDRDIAPRLYFVNEEKMLGERSIPNARILNYQHFFWYDFTKKKVEITATRLWGGYVSADKDNIYCDMDASFQKSFEREWKKMSPSTRKFYEPLQKALAAMDENDNPLLLRYHIRK